MNKSILALTICAFIGSVSVTETAAAATTLNDAVSAWDANHDADSLGQIIKIASDVSHHDAEDAAFTLTNLQNDPQAQAAYKDYKELQTQGKIIAAQNARATAASAAALPTVTYSGEKNSQNLVSQVTNVTATPSPMKTANVYVDPHVIAPQKIEQKVPMATIQPAQKTPTPMAVPVKPVQLTPAPVKQLVPQIAPQLTPVHPQPVKQLVPQITPQTNPQLTPVRGTAAQLAPMATITPAQKTPVRAQTVQKAPMATLTASHKVPQIAGTSYRAAVSSAEARQILKDQAMQRYNIVPEVLAADSNKQTVVNSQQIAASDARLSKLESSTNAKFGQLKSTVDDNRKRASAGIAGVAAMANIPQVIQGQTFSVGAGVGNTDGESAVAVGFSARATDHVVVKASVSDDTQQDFVVGGGVSYGW